MTTFLFVHGVMHGAWCWYKVIPLLEQQGHKAIAIDSPGHGADRTPIADISFDAYVKKICDVIDEQNEPVVLVGHSFGGMLITQAAELRPDKVQHLVYLAAMAPRNGEAAAMGFEDTGSLMPANIQPLDDGLRATVDSSMFKELFYADCANEDIALAKLSVVPELLEPISQAVQISDENFGRIPKTYIHCRHDNAVSYPFQQLMVERQNFDKVITMDTSHSPFFSAPEDLVGHFLTAAS